MNKADILAAVRADALLRDCVMAAQEAAPMAQREAVATLFWNAVAIAYSMGAMHSAEVIAARIPR